jgi:hypothetical protein
MSVQPQPAITAQEMAGERRLRQLLFAVDLLAFLGIGAAALYIWLFWPRGHDVYSDLQQGASETYLLIWMGVALVAALMALSRNTRVISFALSFLLLMECLAQLYFISANHRPYHPWARAILDRFEPHPILVGIPHPGQYGGLSNDSMHRRTTINENKAPDAKQIYVFGGSLTYDVGVRDSQTWASDLSRLLGPHYVVQNYGVPGYSSLEAMVQSLFVFRDVKPVCALYYGSYDLESANITDLASDYSTYLEPNLYDLLGVAYRPGLLARYWLLFQFADSAIQRRPDYPVSGGTVSARKDMRLSKIYTENVGLTADIDRHFGVKAIFVPAGINEERLRRYKGGFWPYTAKDALIPMIREMNLDMERAAKAAGAVYLDAALNVQWNTDDFVDEQHFAASGDEKLAEALAPIVASNCP